MLEGVSVVIPCYNAAKYLREAIESVLAQRYDGPLEVIVSDDGSTDDSYSIAESFGALVRLVRKPPGVQRTTPAALNRGIRAATQPLVAILAADDVFLPGHLTALAEAMARRPELGLVYDSACIMSEDGGHVEVWHGLEEPPLTPDDLLLNCRFGAGSVMVRRCVFDRVGLFDETLKHSEDHDMWLRIVEQYPAVHVPVYGFIYRSHGAQKSRKSTLWPTNARVLGKAQSRYPYRRRTIRKRKAVLAYRFGETAFRERRVLRALFYMAKAGVLDPPRAATEIWNRFWRRLRRSQPNAIRSPRESTEAGFPDRWPPPGGLIKHRGPF